MRHTDYLSQLENDPDYRRGRDELKAHFALGDAIIRARIQKGLSQADLAEMVGTKQANISRLEAASGNPTLKLINKITNVLDIQIKFEMLVATNSFRSIPVPGIRVDNWPTKSLAKSTSSQSSGQLS
jgi:transcriptional regulator with XRE-family HTH domain